MIKISLKIKNKIKDNYRKKADYIYLDKTDKIRIDSYFYDKENIEIKISPEKELLTRGDFNIVGSWPEGVSIKNYYKNEWFHTGQLAEIDEEGYISITGYIENNKVKLSNRVNNFFDSKAEMGAVLILLLIWLSIFLNIVKF
jgi:long-subunit acyl-CoA synthetase (AMP-forming)